MQLWWSSSIRTQKNVVFLHKDYMLLVHSVNRWTGRQCEFDCPPSWLVRSWCSLLWLADHLQQVSKTISHVTISARVNSDKEINYGVSFTVLIRVWIILYRKCMKTGFALSDQKKSGVKNIHNRLQATCTLIWKSKNTQHPCFSFQSVPKSWSSMSIHAFIHFPAFRICQGKNLVFQRVIKEYKVIVSV